MKYEKRIVAFIDILGFSNYIKTETVDKKKQDFLIQKYINLVEILRGDFCISKIQTEKQKYRKEKFFNNTKINLFSDSIIISKTYDEKKLDNQLICLLSDVYNVVYEAYMLGFTCRGGISCGDMIHDNNYLLGPAYIKAYELEQTANYPRIIIDDNFIKSINDVINNTNIAKYICMDFDGY